ncbi:MAG TPA: 2-dehydropantoate 2-reductase N-terminal domain-containing protein, partial [Methanomassiliicoccales archaeon]|nr:2-dehydropantoate 2-reductase N-terminal domain-containing protein [Methanomassiliicoccales archaeon]
MKIVVFGAGAMGSLVGGLLSRKHDVTLIGKPAQIQAIEDAGLAMSGVVEAVFVPKATDDVSVVEQVDAVIMAVKSPSLRPAVEVVVPLMRSDAILVTLQNGLRQLDIVKELCPTGVI